MHNLGVSPSHWLRLLSRVSLGRSLGLRDAPLPRVHVEAEEVGMEGRGRLGTLRGDLIGNASKQHGVSLRLSHQSHGKPTPLTRMLSFGIRHALPSVTRGVESPKVFESFCIVPPPSSRPSVNEDSVFLVVPHHIPAARTRSRAVVLLLQDLNGSTDPLFLVHVEHMEILKVLVVAHPTIDEDLPLDRCHSRPAPRPRRILVLRDFLPFPRRMG
mmetsp:Transcript_51415/g.160453  ORF Transcript_51415/g.160453 Transcript_51415/m.160453 type:complete len:214 (+) Transcript_51415:175-816(+)